MLFQQGHSYSGDIATLFAVTGELVKSQLEAFGFENVAVMAASTDGTRFHLSGRWAKASEDVDTSGLTGATLSNVRDITPGATSVPEPTHQEASVLDFGGRWGGVLALAFLAMVLGSASRTGRKKGSA
jgi:hypothetical protein